MIAKEVTHCGCSDIQLEVADNGGRCSLRILLNLERDAPPGPLVQFWRPSSSLRAGLHQIQGHDDFSGSVLCAKSIDFERPHREYQKDQL